jgi:hypothetical protein
MTEKGRNCHKEVNNKVHCLLTDIWMEESHRISESGGQGELTVVTVSSKHRRLSGLGLVSPLHITPD